jgi:uncharacterized membrane protein YbhN (UPF0104 family)
MKSSLEDDVSEQVRTSPRRTLKILIVVAIQLACIGLVAHTLWKSRSELSGALNLGLAAVVSLLALNAIGHVQRTLEFTYMLRRLGVNEPFAEGFWLTGAGFLLNHLPLNAGFVMRAVVLRRDHSLPYSSYISLTLVNMVINVAMASLIGLAGALSGAMGDRHATLSAVILFSSVLVGCAFTIWMPGLPLPKGEGFIARQIRNLAAGIVMIRGNGSAIAVLALLAMTKLVILSFRLTICFAALGQVLSAFDASLLASVTNLTAIVNITPGNLGLREMALSLVSAELGSSHSHGLAAASIDRVVSLIYIVAAGVPGIYTLRRRGPLADTRPRQRSA